jgi:hypothetical protein
MSRLVLHIGIHKTGTTTIQNLFAENRELLARHGVIYPRIGHMAGHHALLADWVEMPPPYLLEGGTAPVWEWLNREHGPSDRTVMLSSEKFCCGRPVARVDMRELRARLSAFDRIEVVCALRDQASLLQSFYIETAKHRAPGPFVAFVKTALQGRIAGNIWLDYNDLLDHLLTAFSVDEIRMVPRDSMMQHPGGVTGWFLDLLGVPLAAEDLDPIPPERANISPDPLAFFVAHALTNPDFPSAHLIEWTRHQIGRRYGDDMPTAILTRAEEEKLRATFAPLNARLQNRVRAWDADFAMPEIRLPPDRIGRDALDGKFWMQMARRLFRAELTAQEKAKGEHERCRN